MSKIFLLVIPAIILSAFSSCSQTTEPKPPEYKDPREMTWTVDTLAYPNSAQTNMCSIWGSSPTDVWLCGHNSLSRGSIWHFDGQTWKDIDLYIDVEGGAMSLECIYGFDENNVWAVGEDRKDWPNRNGLIISFNGTKWTKYFIDEGQKVYDVWGKSPDDVWICGNRGVIYHYDGESLILYDSVEINYPENGNYVLWSIREYNSDLFILAGAAGQQSSNPINFFLKYSNAQWAVIDSFYVNDRNYNFGSSKMRISLDNNFYSFGSGGLFQWINEQWTNIFPSSSFMQDCIILNDNYKILLGGRGSAYFNDGSNWELLETVGQGDVLLTGVWTDGYEVFIIGYTLDGWPSKTIVWRGK